MEPMVSGVVVLSVGKICPIPEEMEVVITLTLGTTSEVLMLVGRKVLAGGRVPNEAVGDKVSIKEISVIQFVTTTAGLQSRFLFPRVGTAKAVRACTTVSHARDFIMKPDQKNN